MVKKIKSAKTTKKKAKIHKTKTHNLSDTTFGPKKFIKKYPGFIIALIFSIILILLLLSTIEINDPDYESKLMYAEQMHAENIIFVEETLLTLEAELDGDYEDTLEDDYIVSIISDIEWFAVIETQIYSSQPTKDVFVKEIAVAAFRNRLIEINEQFTFDMIGFEPEYTISSALTKEPIQNFISEEDLVEVFEDNQADKELFMNTLNFIVQSYFEEKKNLIRNSSSTDRQFVEAKKLTLFSY